jgi:hypothetical protein
MVISMFIAIIFLSFTLNENYWKHFFSLSFLKEKKTEYNSDSCMVPHMYNNKLIRK